MKTNSRNAIKQALKGLLSELEVAGDVPREESWEFRRGAGGSWSGKSVLRPSISGIISRAKQLSRMSQDVAVVFSAEYPGYLVSVGILNTAGALRPDSMLVQLLREAHKRFGTWSISDEQLESVIVDASRFFDSDTVTLCLEAPALNLAGPILKTPIQFPGGVTLHSTSDEFISRIYGGNTRFPGRPVPMPYPSFYFKKEVETKKFVGEAMKLGTIDILGTFAAELDRCVLALTTYKDSAPVGYDSIYIRPAGLVLGTASATQIASGLELIPFGIYRVEKGDARRIESHARLFCRLDETLEMACQRLVDASRRKKPRDSIIDAVIGLEAILLARIQNRGELRFRFSLNYALLFPKKARKEALEVAKDLYDLRSRIAHGNSPPEKCRIGDVECNLSQAAKIACSALQRAIARFIKEPRRPAFTVKGFWESRQLGV